MKEEEKEWEVLKLGLPSWWMQLKRSSKQAEWGSGLQVVWDTPFCTLESWAGLEHSPAPRYHQLHFHFVGNNDAQDLPVGSFPQPAR